MTPWWDPQMAGWIGGMGGGGLGAVVGIFGGVAGILSLRGKGRRLVLGIHAAFLVLGVALLITGAIALAAGQPYHVYYPFVLMGFILTVVLAAMLPTVRRNYRMAEERRMEAAALRRS